jgi:hypothetical protein
MYDYMKSYLQANFQGETETLVSREGTQVDTRSRNLIVDSSGTEVMTYTETDVTINATEFNAGAKTTGTTTFNNASYPSNGTYDCSVYINSDVEISNVTINGDLHINADEDAFIEYNNVVVTGSIYNDNPNKTLSINMTGASSGTADNPGTGAGQVNIVSLAKFSFTVSPAITGYEWRLYQVDNAGSLQGSIELAGEESATGSTNMYQYSYSTDTTIAIQILPHGNDYIESVTYYTLGRIDQDTVINLTPDLNN